ncbi:DNA/RNA non-specific endonuclease [Pseudoflavonifractor sp. MSJ-37]|uniref:DNA/RNA non-specific endonuclease n=1 Tax=Pseudoflavonifractor sp. MSJ-37 TaxID=2841531 RepID=UPI001C101906|nr:DNA/RNA non-specific endonuclease [Pseudoflavonifractor sp. MSJ-37]MBU5434769.1 DNA/RNA non-specific endonuclease [Pseudoflavonifractor sp. MSJ-37]
MIQAPSVLLSLLLSCGVLLSGCQDVPGTGGTATVTALTDIPAYSGGPYVVVDDNVPEFPQSDFTTNSFESYSPLDDLGRCGVAYVNVGVDLMPTEPRGNISQVRPTGWQSVKYDNVDGKNLYNRCHLIGFQLTGENANKQNLITGTRYMNVDGMLPFENMVADYVKETEHHVLYRVTPVFQGDELVARGVRMEAQSVEDDEVCYDVYVYNVQPGIEIDYTTGESRLSGDGGSSDTANSVSPSQRYVLNTSSKKFHLPDCSGAKNMSTSNRQDYTGRREDLIAQGYTPCGTCKP